MSGVLVGCASNLSRESLSYRIVEYHSVRASVNTITLHNDLATNPLREANQQQAEGDSFDTMAQGSEEA